MTKGIKKVISYVLVICMLVSGILVNMPTMSVLGAPPDAPTVDDAREYVFGNGFPLLIKDDGSGNTKIYWDKGEIGVYEAGIDTEIAVTGDISDYWIIGGGKDITVNSTKITMTGGTVAWIIGGGFASQMGSTDANVIGNIDINIIDGIVGAIAGGGYCSYTGNKTDVGGTININVENKLNCGRFIGGSNGCLSDTYNPSRTISTVKDINISIKNVTDGKLYIMNGSGIGCNQIGDTNISISNSSFSNDDIRNAIYGGIEGVNSAGWTKGEMPKKVGDVNITLDNVAFGSAKKYDIIGGGYYSGIDGSVIINVKDTTNIKSIYGGGYAANNSDGNISGNVEINVSGATTIGSFLCAGGYSVGGHSAYVEGKATIDISGTTSVSSGVYGKGTNLNGEDVSVKGDSKVYISGNPSVGSYYGIDLSTLVDNKVIVNGALTGTTAKIGLKNASSTASGTVVATFNQGITVNTSVFGNYILAADGNNVIIDTRSLSLNAKVEGINGVPIKSESITGVLQVSDDSFTGLSIGDDITSWFSDAANLGITVKVTSVSEKILVFNFSGTPNKIKEKTYITVSVPKTKLLCGIGKQFTSTNNAYWSFRAPEKYDVTHTLSNITATSGTAGAGKISEGTDYTTTLTAVAGYKLPRQIKVIVNGYTKRSSQYTYNKDTGELTIPGILTVNGGNVEIIATALEKDVIDYYLYFDASDKKLYDEDGNEYKEQLDKWSVDLDGNLILNGFEFTTVSYYGLYIPSDTKIILAEDSINTIKCIGQYDSNDAIYVYKGNSDTFTIEGSGILNLDLIYSCEGIYSDVDTYIKNITLNINAGSESTNIYTYGMFVNANLYIINSDVTMKIGDSNYAYGIGVENNITIDDSEVKVLMNIAGTGAISYSGDIIIKSNETLVTPNKGYVGKDGNYNFILNEDGTLASNIKITSKIAKYFVSQELTNVTSTKDSMGTRKAIAGSDYTTTLTAAKGYKLPSSITIKVGGTALNANDYTYDQSTGKIKILAAKVTGKIIIIASGDVIKDDNGNGGNGNNGGDDKGGDNDDGGDNKGDDNKSELGDVKKETNKDEKVPEIILNNILKELEDFIFTEEEKTLIRNGASAKIYLEVIDISDTVSDEDKTIIKDGIDEFKIGEYIDISLFKKVGDGNAIKISNPNGLISITFIMPESLKLSDSSKTRNYKIARIHDGELTIIDGVYDSATGEFTFETDKFSTYAIIYEDVDVIDTIDDNGSTKTGDSAHMWLWMLLAAGAMAVEVVSISRKEKEANN